MRRRTPRATVARLLTALLLTALPVRSDGQIIGSPDQEWRTIDTPHFVVHFPRRLEGWTRDVIARLESERSAVIGLIGFESAQRITILIDDPAGTANGSAWPLLDDPVVVLWAHPPAPPSQIAHSRTWGEIVSVHEVAHIAHLTRPSRNPVERALVSALPISVGPIALRSPRWVDEGYATYVEGRITGSGRPYGIWRPAILRQRAVEGRLPTYTELDGRSGVDGGAMAYLAGSAFLEWLAHRQGDSTLVDLWRRLSARERRSFTDAFVGVYGDTPSDLYARFSAELTAKAIAVEGGIARQGVVSGELVQRVDGYTGAPAVSPDGTRLAYAIRPASGPGRIVVVAAERGVADSAATDSSDRRAAAHLVARDREDVPARRFYPPPRKALATLHPYFGREHASPRWMPGGHQLIVTREEPMGDGTMRADLFVWDVDQRDLRRVTHGAALVEGDPTPDGRGAIATRCADGQCDLVHVDLLTGAIAVLARGSPTGSYAHPRVSPDGRSVAASVQRDGVWRLTLIDLASRVAREIGPRDGVSRYEAAWFPDGATLAVVSEAGGIPTLERLTLATDSTVPVTRVVGAATAPEPSAHGVYFLHRRATGLDLRRLPVANGLSPSIAPDTALYPAMPQRAPTVPPLPMTTVAPSRPYGFGASRVRWLTGGTTAAEGATGTLLLSASDAVGRVAATLKGVAATRGAWRGGALDIAVRRWWPTWRAEWVAAEQRASAQSAVLPPPVGLDARYRAALISAEVESHGDDRGWLRGGLATGALLDLPSGREGERVLAAASGARSIHQGGFGWLVAERLALDVSAGHTLSTTWRRGLVTASLAASTAAARIATDYTYGELSTAAPAFEQFSLGGSPSTLVDPLLLSQRSAQPALPAGIASGRRIAVVRIGATMPQLGGGAIAPYFWSGSVGERLGPWHRVLGADTEAALPPLPFLRVPRVRALAGVGYSLDDPVRSTVRGYVVVSYRP
ncbi:MAG: hypothetical protein NVS1B4_05160 [Gemmatimonadaceae bacterium]